MAVDLLARHAAEAGLLFEIRERAARAPHYSFAGLEAIDERVDAHLDALRLARGRAADAIESAALREPARSFVLACCALDARDAKALAALLNRAAKDAAVAHGLRAALAWTDLDRASWAVRALLDPTCPAALTCLGLSAHVAHRSDPGPLLLQALYSNDPALRRTAMEGAARLGRADLESAIVPALDDADDEVRLAARWTAASFGHAGARERVEGEADATLAAEPILRAVAVRGPSKARRDGLVARLRQGAPARAAILAAAATGDINHVPLLLDDLEHPAHARIAGWAITQITGIGMTGGLVGLALAGEQPNDDPSHKRVALDEDHHLPWPAPEAVRAAWEARRSAMPPGRLLLGRAVDEERCRVVLSRGTQPQREAAAIELGLMRPEAPLLDVSAPAFRQR